MAECQGTVPSTNGEYDAAPAGTAHGDEERGRVRVGGIERALERAQVHVLRPLDRQRPGGMTQRPHLPLVGLVHHPEQPGPGVEQRRRHGEVRGERQRRVVVLGRQPRPQPEEVGTWAPRIRHHLLLGELDSAGASAILGGADPIGELPELGRQLVRRHSLVGQLGPAPDDNALRAQQASLTIAIYSDAEQHRRPPLAGEQAGGALREDRRMQVRLAVRQVHGDTPLPELALQRAAGLHERAQIGDRVSQHEVITVDFEREGLIEVGRRGRVECDEREIGPVGAIRVLPGRGSGVGLAPHLGGELARNVELLTYRSQTGRDDLRGIRSDANSAHRVRYLRAPMNIPFNAS